MNYDLIIIGGGPAGLAAALDAEYLRLKTLVLEARKAGGALSQMYPWKKVDSFLGLKGMKGQEVSDRIVDHVKSAGVDVREGEEVQEIIAGNPFKVVTKDETFESTAVILATGVRGVPKKLGVPGEDLSGVIHFLPKPEKYADSKVLVVGGGDSAADSALGLDAIGAQVWLAHRREDLRAQDESKEDLKKSKVEMLWNTEVESITGNDKVEGAKVFNNKTSEKKDIECDTVLICIGSASTKDHLERLGIKMESALVEVDEDGMTSVPGIFAAGDIVCKIKRIPQALATGERAAYSAYKYIKKPYWK
jgi:thioredoxin reductase (NADPH)